LEAGKCTNASYTEQEPNALMTPQQNCA